METLQIVAIVLFALTYVLLFTFQKYRAYIAFGMAVVFVALGILDYKSILSVIDWNVLCMIAGTMGTVYFFIESKMPARMADWIIKKTPNVKWMVFALSLFAGVVSAFIDNVATVLMIAPVALTICKKLKISPVASLIAIAVSSNLQGAATLVGDTTSILMAGAADMNFLDFFFFKGKMGMFFVVELSALASMLVLLVIFRKETEPTDSCEMTLVHDYMPSVGMIATVVLLILASFLPDNLRLFLGRRDMTNGIICVGVFLLLFIYEIIKTKDKALFKNVAKEMDFFTLLLLASLFMLVGGIQSVGIIDIIGSFLGKLGGGNLFLIYTVVVWASVAFSAFIDNIPYVATMLPVMTAIALTLNIEPYILYFGLLTGATLGGNLSPVGASANIAAIGILRKEGWEVKNSDFLKIGLPFTISAVIVGYLLIWFIWA